MKAKLIYVIPLLMGVMSCQKKSVDYDVEQTGETKNDKTKATGLHTFSSAGATLSADGVTSTYALINSVLTNPPGNVPETSDCTHPAFGDHITQVYDNTLATNVFAFHLHLISDTSCNGALDRQRTEIKTYNPSADSLKAVENETVVYTWKFKLDSAFQASPDFTHLHQIHPLNNVGLPLITVTARHKTTGQFIEVIHTPGSASTSSILKNAALSGFKGQWIEVVETINFSHTGDYQITMTRMSDNVVLLSEHRTNIDMWRTNMTAFRPKWGIYRMITQSSYLRNEIVYFNDFNITEL